MKKINKFLLMGSVALTGAMGLASCSSEDTPDTPGNGDVTAVKTQFALNIPRANGGTRMSADNTQANKNFLGMDEIKMLTFSAQPTTSSTSTSLFGLEKIAAGAIYETASSKIYNDVTVPTGTTHFLFYAHAPQGSDVAEKFAKGYIKLTIPDNNSDGKIATSGINATLEATMGTDTNNESTKILTVLNEVAKVSGWSTTAEGTNLRILYNSFITLKAGSATSVCKELEKLYNELDIVAEGEETARNMATAIRTAITNGGTFTYDASSKKLSTTLTYPRNINLPDGAVMLKYDSTYGFKYDDKSNNVGTSTPAVSGSGFMGLNANNVCFPASIYYFQSSDLAATAQVLENGNWPTSTGSWTNGNAPWLNSDGSLATSNGWTNTVTATTRTIAMRQNINYGVASLNLQAKCNANTLHDNANLSTTTTFTGDVTIPTEGLKVTGLLIGGQPAMVGYDFQPTTDEQFAYVVYDKEVNGLAKSDTYSASNYTIVLPNEIANATEQNTVNIAVEFENNTGVDFRGADGIVPAGGKFYLVGQLKPDNSTTSVSGKTKPAVFMSDYQTTARINVLSLTNAYNTIPDLRSTKMQLGISVDLTWQTGLSFDVELK